jgi:Ser/Thr protein kinase RdoA (MazF antagonist)
MNNPIEADLRQLLVAAYGLVEPKIDLIRTGSDGNQTYNVTTDATRFIARIYGAQARENPDWAQYELEMLTHLSTHGVSVATPVRSREGALWQSLPIAASLPAPVALFTFAEGGVEWPTAPERALLLGAAFARLRRAAESLYPTADPRIFDAKRLFHDPLDRIRLFLDDADPEDAAAWQTLTETAERAAALFALVPHVGGAFGPIHGDLHQGNCHFNSTGDVDQVTFFDFSNAGIGLRVYDLSGFLWPLRDDTIRDPTIKAACDAFLNGYRSVRPLLEEEEHAIPASIKARDFWETGSWLEFDKNVDPAVVRQGLHSLATQFRRFPL